MKEKLLAALLALLPVSCGPDELPEPECLEYKTIVEIPFTEAGNWNVGNNSWSDSNRYNRYSTEVYTVGCFARDPCQGDDGNHFVLGEGELPSSRGYQGSLYHLFQSISLPVGSRVDCVRLWGNTYGRNSTLKVELEDYAKKTIMIDEMNECTPDSVAIDYWKEEKYHAITNDGTVYLKIDMIYCYDAPEMPSCEFRYKPDKEEYTGLGKGCIGLSKIQLQQCVRKKIFTEE